MFEIAKTGETSIEVLASRGPSGPSHVIARGEFLSAPRCELFSSPDGRWALLVAWVGSDYFASDLGGGLLFLCDRDATEPLIISGSLARVVGDATRPIGWCADGRSFHVAAPRFRREGRGAPARFFHDAASGRWLGFVEDLAAPADVPPTDPGRAVLAAAHLGALGQVRAELDAIDDPTIAEAVRALVVERNAVTRYWRARAEQDADRALALFDAVLASAPDWSMAHEARCTLLRKLGRDDAFLDATTRWASNLPEDPDAHWLHGIALTRAGALDAACLALARAVGLDPALREDLADEEDLATLRDRADFRRLVEGAN